jgi:hypothetical protein
MRDSWRAHSYFSERGSLELGHVRIILIGDLVDTKMLLVRKKASEIRYDKRQRLSDIM